MSNTITTTGLKKIFLIKVEPDANNNKFYNFEEVGDGTFKATYGRVGCANPAVEIYPMSKWDSKYKEKLSKRKMYEDVTHLFAEEVEKEKDSPKKSTITEITNKVIAGLVNQLRKYARVSVETNYIVSDQKVTQKMVDEAQGLVDEISAMIVMDHEVKPINKLLVDLFKVIPRKMTNVRDYLFQGGEILDTKDELSAAQMLIGKEQATLDVMAGQVSTNSKLDIKIAQPSTLNILESMGLFIEEAPASDIPVIKDLMGPNKGQFKSAYIITNSRTQKQFDKFLGKCDNKKIELFWHGSRNENWWSILDKGWMIRPSNAVISGKMFGYGIYWANKFQKSLGYTSYRGSHWANGSSDVAFLSLASVHVGKQLKIKNHEGWCYDLSWSNLRKRGEYDSLYAQGGADLRNDEFIVYQEPQCTVKYLIEVK